MYVNFFVLTLVPKCRCRKCQHNFVVMPFALSISTVRRHLSIVVHWSVKLYCKILYQLMRNSRKICFVFAGSNSIVLILSTEIAHLSERRLITIMPDKLVLRSVFDFQDLWCISNNRYSFRLSRYVLFTRIQTRSVANFIQLRSVLIQLLSV